MKVSYINFWPNFDPYNNWFGHMLSDYFKEDIEVTFNIDHADVVMSSIFGSQPLVDGKINILYTGENRGIEKKSMNTIYLGFHPTNVREKIFRLPYWMTCINWWPQQFYPSNYVGGNIVDIHQYSRKITTEKIMNRGFCSIVASNGVSNRFDIVDSLSTIHKVDCYGSAFNNRSERNKIDIIKEYNFNICYENSIGEGYVTEKLFEALLAGTVPIYWGSEFSSIDFNPDALIDTTSMNTTEIIDKVRQLKDSPEMIEEKCNTPIFVSEPSLAPLYEFLDDMGVR